MAKLYQISVPISRKEYESLPAPEAAPPGCISHAAVEVEDGMLVIDMWESSEQADAFYQQMVDALPSNGAEPKIVVSDVVDWQLRG